MRISRHQMFMEIAHVVSKRSTCPRLNVGAVIVINKKVVSIGYNGSLPGEPHCTDVGCLMENGGCKRTIHAEINAINGIPQGLGGHPSSLYVTSSPCGPCRKAIIKHPGIISVYYDQPYRDESINLLLPYGISVYRVTPSGSVINQDTGEVCDES